MAVAPTWLQGAAKRLRQGCCNRRLSRPAPSGELAALLQPAGASARGRRPSDQAAKERGWGQGGSELSAFSASLLDLSDEVYGTALLFLHGYEVAVAGTVCRRLGHFVSEGKLWPSLLRQEFPYAPATRRGDSSRYAALLTRQRCKRIEFRRVPSQRGMRGREAWPHMFTWRGNVFIFSGWESGEYTADLYVSKAGVPLDFREIGIKGSPPIDSYCASIALLEDVIEDDAEGASPDRSEGTLRVFVYGGYVHNGYHRESPMFGIFEIAMQIGGTLSARWERVGQLTPRANHSATYVPPRLSGPEYPEGYVLIVGGIVDQRTVRGMGLLDLATFTWTPQVPMPAEEPVQRLRNSHSATLLRRDSSTYGILVVGGGMGDGTNGNPPRGGEDCWDSFWLLGLENGQFHCTPAEPSVLGRGHVACRLRGTSTLLTLGGGRTPTADATSFAPGCEPRSVGEAGRMRGPPRAFGCGCGLPDGVVLMFGGYSNRFATHRGDVWALRVVGSKSDFFDQIPIGPDPQDEDLEDILPRSPLPMHLNAVVLRALLRGRRFSRSAEDESQDEDEEDDDEDDDEDDEPSADRLEEAETSDSAARGVGARRARQRSSGSEESPSEAAGAAPELAQDLAADLAEDLAED